MSCSHVMRCSVLRWPRFEKTRNNRDSPLLDFGLTGFSQNNVQCSYVTTDLLCDVSTDFRSKNISLNIKLKPDTSRHIETK